jgi:copper chaperone
LAVIAAIYDLWQHGSHSIETFLLIPLGGVTLRAMSLHPKGVSGTTQTPHPANSSDLHLRYLVADMSCEHCRVAVTEEVQSVSGVASVDVDLDAKLVIVHGCDIDGEAVIAAIDEAGYDAVFDAAA